VFFLYPLKTDYFASVGVVKWGDGGAKTSKYLPISNLTTAKEIAETNFLDFFNFSYKIVTTKCGKSAFSRRMRIESELLKDFPNNFCRIRLLTTPCPYTHSGCKLTAAFG